MGFPFDSTGIDPDARGASKILPKKWFKFEIVEFVSKAGDVYPLDGFTKEKNYPKVDILAQVIGDPEYEGERIFHSVTFMPAKGKDGKPTPGAGMAIHFLKSIGQPWEGKLKVESADWVGSEFMGYVISEEYQGKTKNKISEIKAVEAIGAKTESEIPF